jgi:hypothetical protein
VVGDTSNSRHSAPLIGGDFDVCFCTPLQCAQFRLADRAPEAIQTGYNTGVEYLLGCWASAGWGNHIITAHSTPYGEHSPRLYSIIIGWPDIKREGPACSFRNPPAWCGVCLGLPCRKVLSKTVPRVPLASAPRFALCGRMFTALFREPTANSARVPYSPIDAFLRDTVIAGMCAWHMQGN